MMREKQHNVINKVNWHGGHVASVNAKRDDCYCVVVVTSCTTRCWPLLTVVNILAESAAEGFGKMGGGPELGGERYKILFPPTFISSGSDLNVEERF